MEQVARLLTAIDPSLADRYRSIMTDAREPSMIRSSSLVALAQQSVQQRSEAWPCSSPASATVSTQASAEDLYDDDGCRRDSGYRSKRISLFSPSLRRRTLARGLTTDDGAVKATTSFAFNAIPEDHEQRPSSSKNPAASAAHATQEPDTPRTLAMSPITARCQLRTPDPLEQLDGYGDDYTLSGKESSGSNSGTPTRRSLENVLEGLSSADLMVLQNLTLEA
eukprot:m.66081 g.66081  ORF g.66081 m.66081 type:complete len:223 (+) comp14037_c0_seq3:154-822(+)